MNAMPSPFVTLLVALLVVFLVLSIFGERRPDDK
jgi:hypothetical protein